MIEAERPENDAVEEPADDPRVAQALEEYLAALESGQRPDRRAFLAAHAEIADALTGCLDSLELMHAAAPPIKPADDLPAAGTATVGLGGTPLGDFRILREIGRGGMGIVYEAVQLSLDRRVALKVLPFAAALDPKHLQRFRNEAQAAAHLHHTNIVPVYAVGCERGVYYYAMQFIEGKTLANLIHELRWTEGLEQDPVQVDSDVATRLVRKQHGEPAKAEYPSANRTLPVTPLPPAAETVRVVPAASTEQSSRSPAFFRTVARLGAQAADALEHAHQQGIIHRDIKPANLLLADKEHLWVADFGLARCQNDAGLTITGDLVGTIRYMSPEQALAKRGLIDHRTDVYSLGATLYELLTLQPVFPGSDRQELLRQIAADDPRPLRDVRRAVPRELETIVLKALAKSPEDRYATAQELGDDLRRFLDDRPILARRPTWREKGSKWLRRHRGVTFASVIVLLLAVVGLTISTALIAWEQARTRQAWQAEAVARDRAERDFKQARKLLDDFTKFGAEEMADRPEMQDVRRKLLEATRAYYEEFIKQHPDDPSLAESHLHVANILSEIGSPSEALAQAREAERLRRGQPPTPDFQHRLSSFYQNLGPRCGSAQGFLLTQKSVQEELKLTDPQRAAVGQLAAQRREVFHGFRDRSWEEREQTLKDLEEGEKKVLGLLTPEQARRLDQIALQHRGLKALADPKVAEALGLTDAQKADVRGMLEQFGGWRHGGKRSAGRDWKQQLARLLSEAQQAKWQEMTGEPFHGEIRRGPPPWAEHRRHP